nr:hypothetical protein [Micromonospora provocatoris]
MPVNHCCRRTHRWVAMPSCCSSSCGRKLPPDPPVPRQLCTRTVNPSPASAGAWVSEPCRPYGERTTTVGNGGCTGPAGR